MKIRITKFKRLILIGSAVAVFALSISIAASWILYQQTITLLTENLRQTLLSISITQAANINPESIEALRYEEDWQKPEWTEVVSQLKNAKDTNKNIVFMYIFRKKASDPTQMEFVADAESINPYANWDNDPSNDVDANQDGIIEPDGPDKLQWPGQDYPEAIDIPEAYEAYNGPLTARELYEDSYGRVLTGYAPIQDEMGNVVAILATDIKADDFFKITRQTLYPFLVFIGTLTLILILLSFALIYMWGRHAETLQHFSEKLANANERLKELDKLKTEFVSIASHQLRSPLAAIKGYASMLLEGSFGELSLGAREAIGRIFSSSSFMARSVDDFLNVSRIELGRMKYDFSSFDICSLIDLVIDEQQPFAKEKKLKLAHDKPKGAEGCNIYADIGKVKQVLTNLVDNAIKYTPKGSITVKFDRNPEKKTITIMVKDIGMGMERGTIEKLFKKFSRADDANKVNVIGTGLGLYVAKNLIEAQNGRIWAESEGPGKGSTFYIELPEANGEEKETELKEG